MTPTLCASRALCILTLIAMLGAVAAREAASQPIADPLPDVPLGTVEIELQTVLSGLASPLGLAVPDDGSNRLFVYDQTGVVRVIDSGTPLGTPFLDVSSQLVSLGAFDERGFLGFALHPDFASNGKVYTYTSEPVSGTADFTHSGATTNHQSVITEWTVDGGDPNVIDPGSARELLRIDEPQANHNGGTLRFGPDDLLYIALGDGGAGDDEGDGHSAGGNAQDTGNVYGSLLRIDVDGNDSANGNYGVPAGNPFVGGAGVDEIFAFGLRNPYAFSFDTATGDLYVGDVGQNSIEEIDIVTIGENYGWRYKEGSFFFDPNGAGAGFVTSTPPVPVPPGLIDPIAEYDHDDGISVIGGFVYRGSAIPELAGRYVTGDFSQSFGGPQGRLFFINGSGDLNELIIGSPPRALGLFLKGFGQDLAGEIYVMGSQNLGPSGTSGVVLKIVPLPSGPAVPTLSGAGGVVLVLLLLGLLAAAAIGWRIVVPTIALVGRGRIGG